MTRTARRTVTILDVAREAKVSPSTVSLVVNNNDWVSDEMRARVKEVVARLGYAPLRRRRSGASGTSKPWRVAVIFTPSTFVQDSVSVLTRESIAGIRRVLSSRCSQLNLIAGKEVADQDLLVQHMLDERELDGAILLGPQGSDGYLRRLVRSDVAVVVLNRRPHHGEYSAVSVDYFGGGRQGIRHLLKLGHRRIALMVGSRKQWPSRELRKGAMDMLARHGLEPVYDWHRKWTPQQFRQICDQVLASGATAFFTGGYPALDAVNYFESIGLSAPEDISVLGLDDLGFVSSRGRKMSAVGYDVREQGCIAARTLLRMMEDRRQVKNISITIRTRIVEGQTVAAPRTSPAPQQQERLHS